jgi:hypothetical protein
VDSDEACWGSALTAPNTAFFSAPFEFFPSERADVDAGLSANVAQPISVAANQRSLLDPPSRADAQRVEDRLSANWKIVDTGWKNP